MCQVMRVPVFISSLSIGRYAPVAGLLTRVSKAWGPLKAMSGPKPYVVFVLGPPGSGKGTQCQKLVEQGQHRDARHFEVYLDQIWSVQNEILPDRNSVTSISLRETSYDKSKEPRAPSLAKSLTTTFAMAPLCPWRSPAACWIG
ncbi:hypothetical protein V5799_006634 [Amblyomma americanum]|uniref:Uncharacterized protein n=1 Tax=Amblyomma americanum TaxID=6943 RepID=A0AAQ4DVU3_AMBAM